MIVYFDTSAFVPLLIDEPTSDSFKELWGNAERVLGTRLLFVEATSTVERARRADRISVATSDKALARLEQLWQKVAVVDFDELLMLNAAVLASRLGLRGFDSVHCAAALQMNDERVIGASSDIRLNDAWSSLGLAVFDPRT